MTMRSRLAAHVEGELGRRHMRSLAARRPSAMFASPLGLASVLSRSPEAPHDTTALYTIHTHTPFACEFHTFHYYFFLTSQKLGDIA